METIKIDPMAALKTAGPARRRAKSKGQTRKQIARESAFVLLLYWILENLEILGAGEVYDRLQGWREAGRSDPRAVGDAMGAAAGGLDLERSGEGYGPCWENGVKCLRSLTPAQRGELIAKTGKTIEQLVELVNGWPSAETL